MYIYLYLCIYVYIYYIYIYRRANGIYIPKSCNLQHMDSLSLFLDYTGPKPADQSGNILSPHRDIGPKSVFFLLFVVDILISFPEKKIKKTSIFIENEIRPYARKRPPKKTMRRTKKIGGIRKLRTRATF